MDDYGRMYFMCMFDLCNDYLPVIELLFLHEYFEEEGDYLMCQAIDDAIIDYSNLLQEINDLIQ